MVLGAFGVLPCLRKESCNHPSSFHACQPGGRCRLDQHSDWSCGESAWMDGKVNHGDECQ